MSYIEQLIDDVEKTHKNFGQLVAVCQIVTKARKFMLIVAPSGCGKSRAMELIAKHSPESWRPLNLSVAGLASKADKLSNFRSAIIVDDIANIQTTYSRTSTINTLSQLVYGHRVEPSMSDSDFCIENFYGSALVGIQPIILRDLMLSPEWDASIQDKALRYYHMFRPSQPVIALPNVQYENGLDIDVIDNFEPNTESENWQRLVNLGQTQWSTARIKEHFIDMLKAIAALENRKQVMEDDYMLLARLLKPMAIESVVVVKESLEGERYLENDLLVLLTEYFTYGGEFSLKQVLVDSRMSKLSLSQGYRIMASQNGNWQAIRKSPTVYKPSSRLLSILRDYDLEVKNELNK